ncbi:MAG: transposase [Magnetococcales bacterium]|nr:transposase [Magnetococcales bacterium]
MKERGVRIYSRSDAAFASPEYYEYHEAKGIGYAVRLPTNGVLQKKIDHLLTRHVGRLPKKPRVFFEDFKYQAGTRSKPRRVIAKVEWHQGELHPRVGFIITNLKWTPKGVIKFNNKRGTAEQWIKEGKNAIRWTRLSCVEFKQNAVRLQLFALAYNLANFMRTLALPKEIKHWSLTTLREKLIKI